MNESKYAYARGGFIDPTSGGSIGIEVSSTFGSPNLTFGPDLSAYYTLMADPQIPAFLLSGTCPSFPVYRDSARTQSSGSGEPLMKLMDDLFGDAHADIPTLPPQSIRRLTVKARRRGQAEPLPLDLEDD
jgi:hypothetical protein